MKVEIVGNLKISHRNQLSIRKSYILYNIFLTLISGLGLYNSITFSIFGFDVNVNLMLPTFHENELDKTASPIINSTSYKPEMWLKSSALVPMSCNVNFI